MNVSLTYCGDHLAIHKYSSLLLFTVSLSILLVACSQLQSKNIAVVPWYPRGVVSRIHHRHPKPWMLKSVSLLSGSSVLHLWIQPTTDHVVLYLFCRNLVLANSSNTCCSKVNCKGEFPSECLHHSPHFISLHWYCIISEVHEMK